jgi:hypothetical protein
MPCVCVFTVEHWQFIQAVIGGDTAAVKEGLQQNPEWANKEYGGYVRVCRVYIDSYINTYK